MRRRTLATLTAAAAFGALALAGAGRLHAQPIPWNPPCTATKFFNNTPCGATVTVNTIPPGVIPPTFVPGNSAVPIVVPVGTTVTGVTTQAGAIVPVVQPGPPLPPPNPPGPPTTGWCSGVVFGPPPGCCFDVYFIAGASGCYIWLEPGTPPCTP